MKNKKSKIIVSLVVVIMLLLLSFYFINIKETHTDIVKKYEVSESDDSFVKLNILEEIHAYKFNPSIIEDKPLKSIKKDINFQYVLNIIKDYDSTFNEVDYTFNYNGASLHRNVVLTYSIDGKIETNKGYNVFCEDNKVNYILITGVEKKNIDKIKNTDNKKLLELASNFKGDYKAQKIYEANSAIFKTDKVLSGKDTIDTNNIKFNISNIEEKYFYDYNTEKLIFEAIITAIEEDGSKTDGGVISVTLN